MKAGRIMTVSLRMVLVLVVAVGARAAATDLDGGTETFTVPEDIDNGKLSVSVTNSTGALVCDFVIRVVDPAAEAPPFQITRAYLNDPNTNAESWRVDDDNDGQLGAGEVDDQPPAATGTVRIEEHGKDHCLARGRTGTLELDLDQNPRKGDKIKISPTSESGGVIFVSSLPGCAEVGNAYVLFPTGLAVLTNGTGQPVTELSLSTGPDIQVVSAASPTHGGFFDAESHQLRLTKPFGSDRALELAYELSGFDDAGSTVVCFGETLPVKPADLDLALQNER